MLTCSSFSLPSQVSSISAPQIQSTCRSTSFVFFTFLCVYAPESFHKKLSSYFAHPLLLSSQARQTTGRLLTMLVCYAEHRLDGKTGPCALRGCSHITSAKNRVSYTPPPPSVSNGQHFALLYYNFRPRLFDMQAL